MAELEIYLSAEDMDRLFALKKEQGFDELTGNQFAERLLERTLRQLHPVIRDDE